MTLYEIYAHTEIGTVRMTNEDHILVGRFVKNRGSLYLWMTQDDDFFSNYGLLFAVADGIGGEAGGAIASEEALTTLERHFYAIRKTEPELYLKTLKRAIDHANINLLQTARDRPEFPHLGCTLTGICLTPQGFLVFNCGDSRVYHHTHSKLIPLTVDDTVTQWAVRSGRMSIAIARRSEHRHKLTNFLGYNGFSCAIDHHPQLQIGDILLICSDGLHDLVEDELLSKLLDDKELPLPALGQKLVQNAISNGGYDNISLILIKMVENNLIPSGL